MLPLVILFLNLGTGEVFLIILVIIMFFGTKNLPQLARGLGKGIRDFREAAGNIQREIQSSTEEIKQNINLNQEMSEIRQAAAAMQGDIQQGLDNIDRQIEEGMKEEEKKKTEEQRQKNLAAAEKNQLPEAEQKQENPVPPTDEQAGENENPIPGSIRRK